MGRARSVPASSSSLLAIGRWFFGLIEGLPGEKEFSLSGHLLKISARQHASDGHKFDDFRGKRTQGNEREEVRRFLLLISLAPTRLAFFLGAAERCQLGL